MPSSGVPVGRRLWAAAGLVAAAAVFLGLVLWLLVGWPPMPWAGVLLAPLLSGGTVLVQVRGLADRRLLVAVCTGAGLITTAAALYLLIVVGLGDVPRTDGERQVLALSLLAATAVGAVCVPLSRRLSAWAWRWLFGEPDDPVGALDAFGARMSRAFPMDELLLQLAETLHRSLSLTAAEVWTGGGGHLQRTAAVPHREPAPMRLPAADAAVVVRARVQGTAWIRVWLPSIAAGRAEATLRCIPIVHLGQLLGLIVLQRPVDGPGFGSEEDRVVVELARRVGLALHNVNLDSALQESLAELRRRNAELVDSRARVVAAADETRRRIERDLHDGAQQHLAALAVKIAVARSTVEPGPDANLLDDIRRELKETLAEVRELAHGIYPPLLRDRGLAEALRAAAARCVLPATVHAPTMPRLSPDREAAVYFCCLEALQNAEKHAGPAASVRVELTPTDAALSFEVGDDGRGFDARTGTRGQGFDNMRDRLGAFGGTLTVVSEPGCGTTVAGVLPTATATATVTGVAQ